MQKICVLTGAGISKESGIATFRDCKDGLWNNYKIDEVASPKGWRENPKMVLDFYNERRENVKNSVPNDGHYYLAKLQDYFDVTIFTQNIDDLHERAGSKNVYHIHGDITKARSSKNEDAIIDIGFNDIKIGDLHTDGSQLRPHVVFFDEFICFEQEAEKCARECDYFIVVGTSLLIYPAAAFPKWRKRSVPLYVVDPSDYAIPGVEGYKYLPKDAIHIQLPATTGMKVLYDNLVKDELEGIEKLNCKDCNPLCQCPKHKIYSYR